MADAYVRPARPDDAASVATVQLSTWRTAYAGVIPASVLDGLGEDDAAAQWRSAITEPPTDRHHVLVAREGETVVGFVAVGPALPEDLVGPGHEWTGPADESAAPAEPTALGDWAGDALAISALLVEPRWGRRGHGSRLLAAAVDLARTDGFSRAVAWVLEADTATRPFLESAGWAPDGVGRVLDMDGTEVPELRLVTTFKDA